MDELLYFLFWLLVVLTVLALVGHGIWVLVAATVRGLGGLFRPPRMPTIPAEMCPRCGEAWDRRFDVLVCYLCGWSRERDSAPQRVSPEPVIEHLRRRIERYHQLGLLPRAMRDRLIQSLQAEVPPPPARAPRPVPLMGEVAASKAPAPPAPARVGEVEILEILDPEPKPPTRPVAEVADRAQAYREFLAETGARVPADAATMAQSAPDPAPAPERSQRLLTLLGAFLEEKNIRWGELVGGLLIVGCSLALVVSFWSSIAERPLLKFGLFNGVTALLFGLGVHAERRWRLPTTALGLLVIATLLTPLNFLAVASLGRGTGGGPIWAVAGELVTIGLFAALVSRAGRTLVARSPTALALGVLAPSVAMFAIRRYVHPGAGSAALLSLGAVPWLAQGVAVGGVLFRERRVAEIPEALAHELLRLLGLTAFAAALALGLLLAQGGPIGPALHRLSPLVPLAAAPALVAGLWLWRKTTDPDRAGDRTAGTSIAALATLVLLAGVVLAWPDPAGMLPVAVLNFGVLTAVALAFEVPAAHVLAGACLAVAYLLGVLVATGRLGWAGATPDEAARALASARGGTALVPLVLLYGGAAAEGLRRGRRLDAQALAVVTVLAAVLSLGLVTWHGFGRPGDPVGATWVYAVLAAAALAGAIRFGRDPLMAGAGAATTRTLGWTGLGLILAALVQGLVFGRLAPAATRPDLALMSTVTPEMVFGPLDWGAARAWVLALLVHATLTTAGVMVLSRLRRDAIPSDPEFEPEPGRRSPPPPQPSPTKGEGAGSVHSTPTGEAGTIAPSHFRGGGAPTKGATDSWATPEIVLRDILRQSSLATSIATGASVAVVAVAAGATAATLAMDLLWLALVWLALAWRDVAPRLFAAAQAALTGSVVAAVTALLQGRGWYASAPLGWLDPWSVQAHALALGGLALGWIGVRVGVRARRIGRSGSPGDAAAIAVTLLEPPWPAFDRWLRGAVVLALVALAVYGVLPGAARELTPRDLAVRLGGAATAGTTRVVPPAAAFEIDGVPHGHALGVGSWAVLVVALAVLLAGQWERFRRVDLLGTLLAGTMAAPLAAGWWEADVAAASALRWAGAIALLAASGLIWGRRGLAAWADRLGWRVGPEGTVGLGGLATATALALTLLPLAAMGGYVGAAALLGGVPEPGLEWMWAQVGLLFVTLGTVACVLWVVGGSPRPVTGGGVGASWARPAGTLLMLLGVLPLVAVTLYVVAAALRGNPIVGPEPGSFFARIGRAGSYVPPIVLVAATLIGYAARERSAGFAFAAALTWNLAATAGFLLAGAAATFDAVLWVRLAQLNAVVAGVDALAWMGAVVAWRRRRGPGASVGPDGLLGTLIHLGVALNLLVLFAGVLALVVDPVPGPLHPAIAGPLGWAALLLAAGAIVARAELSGGRVGPGWVGLGLVAGAAFLALGLSFRDVGDWRTYHGLLAGEALAGGLALLTAWQRAGLRLAAVAADARGAAVRWAGVALGMVVLLALRASWSDPQWPWWTVGGLAVMAPLAAALAVWARRPGRLYLAGFLLNVAATYWWVDTPWARRSAGSDLLNVNIIALALPAPVWLWIDRRWLRPAGSTGADGRPGRVRVAAVPFGRVAAWVAVGVLAQVVALGLADDAAGGGGPAAAALGWAALAAATVAMAAGLWDEQARTPVAGLYLLGLVASGWAVHQFHLPPRWLVWTGTMVLAAYSVATSYLWSRRGALRALADRLGVPRPEAEDPVAGLAWLVPAGLTVAAGVLVLAFGAILTEPDAVLRSSAAHAALAEVLAIGLVARGERRGRLQLAALAVGVVGATAWGWAWIAPGAPFGGLDRLVVVLAALVGCAGLYGLGLAKLVPGETEWTGAARRLVPGLLGLAAGALAVVLAVAMLARAEGRDVPMSAPAVAAVALTLAGAVAAALVAAVVPGRDPLGLSERGRTAYVYGAEVLLAVLMLHLRLTRPGWFGGVFTRYWPLILLGVAFLGVGLAELFRRQGRLVLAEPLERTGALLPVFPLLAAFWAQPRPGEDVLFFALVGGLYTALSVLRTSLGFAALAALGYNAALWAVLGRWEGFGLAEHPQIWVIPPALCVLVGATLNRDRLTAAQLAAIRYAASLAIFLASTADVVLIGVDQAPWLPLVLAGLSLTGIFAGIVLRIRGFLFLGTGFLTLALFLVVWHAAVDLRQTWLWWACGIVAGILILALFALFEKKRQEVLKVVDQLKEWQP